MGGRGFIPGLCSPLAHVLGFPRLLGGHPHEGLQPVLHQCLLVGGKKQVHAQFPVWLARRQNTAEPHSNSTTSHHLQLLASSWPSWGSPQPPHGLPGGKPHLPHGLPGGVPDFPLTFLGGHSKASLMDIPKSWTRCCRLWLLMPLVISAGAEALHGPLCPVLLQPTGSHDAMRSVNQVSVDSAGRLP